MRHRNKGRKLNRTASHKKALMRNLANQLIEHKEIKTTTAKAKEARSTVERLITYAKKGDTHHRRLAFGFLRNKESIKILFDEIAPAFAERQGGYTRVLKLGQRQGDSASLSLLQLVGFEKLADTSTKSDKKKKTKKKESKEKVSQDKKITDQPEKSEEIPEAEVVEETSDDQKAGKKSKEAESVSEEKTEEVSESEPEQASGESEATSDDDPEKTEEKK
jgi:large subunit ribosomal protein L17